MPYFANVNHEEKNGFVSVNLMHMTCGAGLTKLFLNQRNVGGINMIIKINPMSKNMGWVAHWIL
jgi:hypothetical protein